MVLVVGGTNQGKYAFAKSLSDDVVRDFHVQVHNCMKQGKDPWELMSEELAAHSNGVFTMAELGCGLVPTDPFMGKYRETAGRISCALAAQAKAVYRVCCGIAVQIK